MIIHTITIITMMTIIPIITIIQGGGVPLVKNVGFTPKHEMFLSGPHNLARLNLDKCMP